MTIFTEIQYSNYPVETVLFLSLATIFNFLNFFSLDILKNQKSQIALNESKLRLACYECGNKMAKRQPLVKTNGILFMKNREEHVLEQFGIFENYENCAEQAFTRSEIVQGMCYIYFCPVFKSKWYFISISALAKIDRYYNISFSENTKLSKIFSDFLFWVIFLITWTLFIPFQ